MAIRCPIDQQNLPFRIEPSRRDTMTKRCLAFTLAGILLAAGVFASLSQVTNPLDPLKVCPETHKLLFENAMLRVIEAKVPPGSTEPKHSHPRGITVFGRL
jgi:hypothetical protein